MKIQDNVVVTMHYRLFTDDGEMVEESYVGEPLMYLHGHSNIIPGLERELEGLAIGEKKNVTVPPDAAYGEYDEDDTIDIERGTLPDDLDPELGMMIGVMDDAGNRRVATIAEVTDSVVTLDFNHPLAGETLRFEVEITDLRAATDEEINHGHVHNGDHH